MTSPLELERMVRLPLRRWVIATDDEVHSEVATVHCPLSAGSRRLEHCQRCPRFLRVGACEAFIECQVPVDVADPHDLCGELLSPDLTCLDSELAAERAFELLEIAGVTSAPVLDDNNVLIGVISTTELARMRLEHAQPGASFEVEDAMTTRLVTLSQQATLGEAARLMASHHLDRLPIVTDDGHLVGVISAMDLVRWLASRLP